MECIAQVIEGSNGAGVDWDSPAWCRCETNEISNHMGDSPEHFPRVQFKVGYDDDAIRVMFRVEDRFVRATRTQYQDSVCLDSCVEFFFSPGDSDDQGYFNLEVNCVGTALFEFHPDGENGEAVPVAESPDLKAITTLTGTVDPEEPGPLVWLAECLVPLSLLDQYTAVAKPAKDVAWRANFYKCADESSHPHWLTWAPVEWYRPAFHKPEFFGTLRFG